MNMEKDIGKLGIVLGAQNEIIRDTLRMLREQMDMLKEQQKRQVRIIWASLFIMALAVSVTGVSIFCTYNSFNRVADQVHQNTQLIANITEVIQNAHNADKIKELP